MSTLRQTIVLHIGLCKTGTTSTQHFLDANYAALMRRGILYPRTGLAAHHHYEVARCFVSDDAVFVDHREQILANLQAEICSWRGRILLSSEHFSFLKPSEIQDLSQFLGPDAAAIVFLREQVHWATAMYAEAVRWGYHGSFKEHLSTIWPLLNYSDFLKPWEQSFGIDNIKVITYEGNTIDKMLDMLDIYEDDPISFTPVEHLLPTLPAPLIELQRELGLDMPDGFSLEPSLHREAQQQAQLSSDFTIPPEVVEDLTSLESANDEVCSRYSLPRPLFGVELAVLLQRNQHHGYVQSGRPLPYLRPHP